MQWGSARNMPYGWRRTSGVVPSDLPTGHKLCSPGSEAGTHRWSPCLGTVPSHHKFALTPVFVVRTPFSIDDAFTDHGGCSGTLRGTSSRNGIPPNELPGAHVNDRRWSPLHRGWRLRNASKIRPPVVRMSARTHWAIVHVKRSRPRMETVRDDQPVTGYGPADR